MNEYPVLYLVFCVPNEMRKDIAFRIVGSRPQATRDRSAVCGGRDQTVGDVIAI